jgi:diguanylate cyclase (GGDEF)-like protein
MLLMNQFNLMSASLRSSQEEMTAIYEELTASEETLQDQYDELVRNRDQIAESERRYKLVFSASNEGLWDIDINEQLRNYSPNWFKNYFVDYSEKTLKDWIELIHLEDKLRFEDSINKHLSHMTPYFHELYRVRDLKGQYRLIQSRGKAEFDTEGHLITLAGSHLDVTDQKANEEQILRMAYFDQTTDLANRRNFERELDYYFEQHQWGRIIYIDINAFKNINEEYGYIVGDQVLRDLSEKLRTVFKDAFIARVAGDEFAVVLEGMTDEDVLTQTLEQLNNNCCQINVGDVALEYKINIVQCRFPNEGKNTEEVFAVLLNKMKVAKKK